MTQGTQPLTRPFSGIAIPAAGTYQLDPPHTFITFSVQHMVVGRVRGRFNSCSGTITVAEDPTQSSLEVSVDTASVDTHHDVRDEDLRGAHFLDVKTFPVMIYRATGVTPDLDGRWTLDGELTVRDITRPVPLCGTFQGAIIDPFGNTRVAFHASAAVSRKEFGLTRELERESGGLLLGKDIVIDINAETILQP